MKYKISIFGLLAAAALAAVSPFSADKAFVGKVSRLNCQTAHWGFEVRQLE
jgi:hypothetical protein